jgi:hypothetical protein
MNACKTINMAAAAAQLLAFLVALHSAPAASAGFTCGAGNDATACAVLGDLYTATNGAGWASNRAGYNGWRDAAVGIATDYCTFEGVMCNDGNLTKMCVRNWKV